MANKNDNHNIDKRLALTLIFSGAVLILLAFVLMRIESIFGWIGFLLSILRPVFIGVVLTFILYGPTVRIEQLLKKFAKEKKFPCRAVSVLITYICFLGIVAAIIGIVVPSFVTSIDEFSGKFSGYMGNIRHGIENLTKLLQNSNMDGLMNQMGFSASDVISQVTSMLSKIPEYLPTLVETIGTWATGLVGILTDIVFGIVFSVYILFGRNRLKRQVNRILKTFCSERSYQKILYYTDLIFQTFSGFVSGQLMEALILGLLCFIGMSILGFQYATMISVVIGVTNIIPILGPIIGTIPGALIYLMIDPWKAIWFVIFVIVIQQIDSNLIYPRVVGSSVGLPAIWILFAVTVGGGLNGVLGMVLGVPIMSLIYTILRERTAENATEEEKQQGDSNSEHGAIRAAVEQQTSKLVKKVRTTMRGGFNHVMDRIDERVHLRDKLKHGTHANEKITTEKTVDELDAEELPETVTEQDTTN